MNINNTKSNPKQFLVFFQITIIFILIESVKSFYFTLTPNIQKCFDTTVYLNQRLLIQAESPILENGHQAIIKVLNKKQIIQEKTMNNIQMKLTIARQDKVIQDNDLQKQHLLEYSTCIIIKSNNQKAASILQSKNKYIFSLTLTTNFDHIIQKKSTKGNDPKRNQNLDKIDELALKIIDLNHQQIQLHQNFLGKQKQTDDLILYLKQKIHFYTVIECLIVMISAGLNVYLLRKYLIGNNLI